MDSKQFEILSKKLDAIIVLLSLDRLGDKSKKDSILLLNQFGLDYSTIASIVGTTVRSVTVVISDAKKARVSKDGKKDKVAEENNQDTEQEDVEGLPS
jgi:hypothetical protein